MDLTQRTRAEWKKHIRDGKSPAEASRLANEWARAAAKAPAPKPGYAPPAPPPTHAPPAPAPEAVPAPEAAPAPEAPAEVAAPGPTIPADWNDLPWPELKVLAEKFELAVTSKAQARDVISKELLRRAGA